MASSKVERRAKLVREALYGPEAKKQPPYNPDISKPPPSFRPRDVDKRANKYKWSK